MTCSALLCHTSFLNSTTAETVSQNSPSFKAALSDTNYRDTKRNFLWARDSEWHWYVNTAPELQQIYSVLGADTRGDRHVRWGMWSNCTFPHFCSQPQISSPKTCLKSVYSPSKSEARWSNRLGGRRKCRQRCHVLTANSDIGTTSSYLISFTGTFFWRSCCTIPCSSEGSKISKASPSSLYLNKIKIFKCINTIFILHFDKMSRWHEIT